MALILDGSESISKSNFRRLRQFTADAVTAFNVNANGSHMAVVEYSDQPTLISGFEGNKTDLEKKIEGMNQSARLTYINRAINFANDEVFQVDKGMRRDVKKVSTPRCRR